MATRRSTRKIKAPPLASAPTAMSVLLATAPTAKRRRQDTSALDEKQPRSAKSVVEPQRGKGSSQHRAAACTAAHCTSVVMLSVPDDFVLPQVACRYGTRCRKVLSQKCPTCPTYTFYAHEEYRNTLLMYKIFGVVVHAKWFILNQTTCPLVALCATLHSRESHGLVPFIDSK